MHTANDLTLTFEDMSLEEMVRLDMQEKGYFSNSSPDVIEYWNEMLDIAYGNGETNGKN
jgi:hypothetical protein